MKTMEKNIARIDYLNRRGTVVSGRSYEDIEEFASDLNDELACGVSLRVTFVDDNGEIVSKNLMNDYDCLPQVDLSHISGNFAKAFERNLSFLAKAYSITDEPTEVRL